MKASGFPVTKCWTLMALLVDFGLSTLFNGNRFGNNNSQQQITKLENKAVWQIWRQITPVALNSWQYFSLVTKAMAEFCWYDLIIRSNAINHDIYKIWWMLPLIEIGTTVVSVHVHCIFPQTICMTNIE